MNSLEIPILPSINQTVERIKKKEISVTEIVTAHLELAKKINPKINAFISILDSALIEAKKLDNLIAEKDPATLKKKLLGIPFTVKDLYLVKGTKTTFSSKLMEDFIAPYTSTVVQKCLDEGAILIGKCNSDPWGFGGSGENSGYGPTLHPMDFTRTPGGSSSGSAASLLAGVGFFSLGTDTGGSVRLPASFCGLYGLKPTYGRNSRYGIGAMASSFDTPGFFARNTHDIKLLESIMEGRDKNDATTYNNVKAFENQTISKPLKIGIPKEYFGEGLSLEVKNAINKVVGLLKDNGVQVVEVSLPTTKFGLGVYYVLVPSEISSNRARYDGVRFGKKESDNYEKNLILSRSKYLEAEVKRRIMIGTYALSAGYSDQFYKQASLVRTKLKNEYYSIFNDVDLLIAPVSPETAFKIGEKSMDPLSMYLVDIYTVTANIVGIPALAVPIGKDSKNLPIGLQIMGNKFQEEKIYHLAGTIEKLIG